MDVHQALLGRKTIHDYEPVAIPRDALLRALAAAIRAPNHRMTEPWRFTEVGPETRRELARISVDIKQQKAAGQLDPSTEQATRDKVLSPAALIVVSQIRSNDATQSREDYAAVACAIQNFSLSLFAEGIGSKWSTGGVTRDPRTYRALGIDPGECEIVGFVWAGIARREPPRVQRKRSLEELLRVLP